MVSVVNKVEPLNTSTFEIVPSLSVALIVMVVGLVADEGVADTVGGVLVVVVGGVVVPVGGVV